MVKALEFKAIRSIERRRERRTCLAYGSMFLPTTYPRLVFPGTLATDSGVSRGARWAHYLRSVIIFFVAIR